MPTLPPIDPKPGGGSQKQAVRALAAVMKNLITAVITAGQGIETQRKIGAAVGAGGAVMGLNFHRENKTPFQGRYLEFLFSL